MMTIKSTLEITRPSPGPGFESRAVAAAMVRARRNRRQRIAVAGGLAGVLAAAGIAAALVIGDRDELAISAPARELPTETPVADDDPPVERPLPAGSASKEAAAIAAGPAPSADSYDDLEIPASARPRVDRVVLELKKREIKLAAEIELAELELAQVLSSPRVDRKLVARRSRDKARLVGELELVRTLAWVEIRAVVGSQPLLRKTAARRVKRPKSKSGTLVPQRKSGVLKVDTMPYSKVLLDGRMVGITPLQIKVKPGRHRVTFRYSDGQVQHEDIEIKPGQTRSLFRQGPPQLLE